MHTFLFGGQVDDAGQVQAHYQRVDYQADAGGRRIRCVIGARTRTVNLQRFQAGEGADDGLFL